MLYWYWCIVMDQKHYCYPLLRQYSNRNWDKCSVYWSKKANHQMLREENSRGKKNDRERLVWNGKA